jgi:hypothetical protein
MRRVKSALAVAVALGAAACAPPVPKAVEPSGDTQGAVIFGMTVRGREFPNIVPHRVETAYFAQVGLDGQLDRDNLLLSNFRAGDYVVLLNIPPGRYAPVAGSYFHKNVRYLVKLDPELSDSWIVEVRPGHVAFVGDALLRTEWEGALLAILNMLKNIGAFVDPLWHPTINVEGSSPRLDKAVEDEAAALHAARRSLSRTQWVGGIDNRLAELGNPPEPIRHGAIFKTTVKPIPAGRFAYIDTLGWGPPRKAPGGLEWVEPGKKAMVQVLFLQPGMAGYKPPEQYLVDMREAGSPDDSHNLYEVALASRTASAARYTIYQYPQASLTGSEVRVYVTETMMVQDVDGIYIIRLRALRESFDKLHSLFRRFTGYVVFLPREIPT